MWRWWTHTSLPPVFLWEQSLSFSFCITTLVLLHAVGCQWGTWPPLRIQVYLVSCAAGANAASWITWQRKSWEPASWHCLCQNLKMLLSQTFKALCETHKSYILVQAKVACVTIRSMPGFAGEWRGECFPGRRATDVKGRAQCIFIEATWIYQ